MAEKAVLDTIEIPLALIGHSDCGCSRGIATEIGFSQLTEIAQIGLIMQHHT